MNIATLAVELISFISWWETAPTAIYSQLALQWTCMDNKLGLNMASETKRWQFEDKG